MSFDCNHCGLAFANGERWMEHDCRPVVPFRETQSSDRVRVKFNQTQKGVSWEFTIEGQDAEWVQGKVIEMRAWCEAQVTQYVAVETA
jgi:hypothetical protein